MAKNNTMLIVGGSLLAIGGILFVAKKKDDNGGDIPSGAKLYPAETIISPVDTMAGGLVTVSVVVSGVHEEFTIYSIVLKWADQEATADSIPIWADEKTSVNFTIDTANLVVGVYPMTVDEIPVGSFEVLSGTGNLGWIEELGGWPNWISADPVYPRGTTVELPGVSIPTPIPESLPQLGFDLSIVPDITPCDIYPPQGLSPIPCVTNIYSRMTGEKATVPFRMGGKVVGVTNNTLGAVEYDPDAGYMITYYYQDTWWGLDNPEIRAEFMARLGGGGSRNVAWEASGDQRGLLGALEIANAADVERVWSEVAPNPANTDEELTYTYAKMVIYDPVMFFNVIMGGNWIRVGIS